MNYLILKGIIEATLSGFSCRQCGSRAHDKDILVLGTAGNALNLEVTCPQCKVSGVVKAEVNVLPPQTARNADTQGMMEKIVRDFSRDSGSIRDEDILSLRESLKKNISVEDLLK